MRAKVREVSTISAAITANALSTVEQVSRHTQAGTGCGGCRVRVQALLDAIHLADAERRWVTPQPV